MEHTATDGKKYQTEYYNLDAIISVGYRVNSIRATQFRRWATNVLKIFTVQGYVLDKAIKEISDKADIQIKYEQFKEGRKVSHILLKFIKKKETKQKKSKDQNTVDMFNGMTIKQIMMFSDKLSRDTAFQNHYTAHVGELEREYAIRIGEELAKPERVLEWMPYLKAVGYVPNKK